MDQSLDTIIKKSDPKIERSLEDIIKDNRVHKRINRARGGGGGGESNNNGSSSPVKSADPLSTSLGDLISNKKKQHHIERNRVNRKSPHHGTSSNVGGLVITVQNNHRHHNSNNHFRSNGGGGGGEHPLLRSEGDSNYHHRQNNHHHHNNHHNGGGSYRRTRSPQLERNMLQKRRELSANIDHSLFDPRGIRDYSQVKKSLTPSMNGGGRGGRYNNSRYDRNDYQEEGATLRVSNIAPSVTLRDLGRVFSVIGEVSDYDLLHHLDPIQASVVYKRRDHALQAIERFNGVPLDGHDLHIVLEEDQHKQPLDEDEDEEDQQEGMDQDDEVDEVYEEEAAI